MVVADPLTTPDEALKIPERVPRDSSAIVKPDVQLVLPDESVTSTLFALGRLLGNTKLVFATRLLLALTDVLRLYENDNCAPFPYVVKIIFVPFIALSYVFANFIVDESTTITKYSPPLASRP